MFLKLPVTKVQCENFQSVMTDIFVKYNKNELQEKLNLKKTLKSCTMQASNVRFSRQKNYLWNYSKSI